MHRCLPYCSYLTVEWRAKKHDLPPKLFDGMRASYPGVREGEGREKEGRREGKKVAMVCDVIDVSW